MNALGQRVGWSFCSRSKPGIIVSDHGTEFTSNAILAWSKDHSKRFIDPLCCQA